MQIVKYTLIVIAFVIIKILLIYMDAYCIYDVKSK